MIQPALRILFIITTSTSTSWVPESPYKCFEHDYPPVDTSATFYDDCKDIHGNSFKPTRPEDSAQLTSCCECLEYKCTYLHKTKILYWETSVSNHCCLACTNTTYKADTVIETIELEDDCKSIETQVCRKLPGHEKAKIESEFNYKACCNDNTGLQVLGAEVYQPSTCSQRTCFYDKYLPFSVWISKQVIPGCDCCLRSEPKTGKEYLVADGTTWVVNGKVFECCRGDIVMKIKTSTTNSPTHSTTTHSITTHSTTTHSTTTRRPTHSTTTNRPTHSTTTRRPTHITTSVRSSTTTGRDTEYGNVVLITGGHNTHNLLNATAHSAEIFLPNSPDTPCILPDLPARYRGHTQDGGLLCGGDSTRNSCRQWNSKEGKFPEKIVHEFTPGRYLHVSWTSVSKKETFLIGGIPRKTAAENTSNILKPGVFEGKYGFNVTKLYFACSITDPDTDTVIITGGEETRQNASLYNEDGFVKNLDTLNYQRVNHGCTSYIHNNKRIFLVTGGLHSNTTEILEDKKWIVLKNGNLPLNQNLAGLRLATIDNQVFSFGGFVEDRHGAAISSIFKFNIDEGRWYNQSYHMSRPRSFFGISIVDYKYYSSACLGKL